MAALPVPAPAGRDALAVLAEAVDVLVAERPADLPGALALDRARVLLAEAARLKTVALLALADVDVRELHVLDGAGTTGNWVEGLAVAGVDRSEVTLARRLPRSPRVTEALLTGRLGPPAAARIGAAVAKATPFLDRPDGRIDGQPGEEALAAVCIDGVLAVLAEQTGGVPDPDPEGQALLDQLTAVTTGGGTQRDRLERALVLLGERSAPGLLRSSLDLLLDALLPAEHEARARLAEETAGVDLIRDQLGGGWLLRGQLDAVTGELLAEALTAGEARDPGGPADTAARRAAGEAGVADLPADDRPTTLPRPRSRAARAHAALGWVLRRALDARALGTRDKALPHLAVTVDHATLLAAAGALPARAAHGSRLTRRQVRDLACTAEITRLVLGARQRVIAASHTQRTATWLERLVVHTEWAGRCAATGCGRGLPTGHRLTPHHADLFRDTGTTSLADTIPLCDRDHDLLHHARRPIRLRDGRRIGPDGWIDPRGGQVVQALRPDERPPPDDGAG